MKSEFVALENMINFTTQKKLYFTVMHNMEERQTHLKHQYEKILKNVWLQYHAAMELRKNAE